MKDRVEIIRCDAPGCTCVVAERRRDGSILLKLKHHGELHVTIIEPWPTVEQQDLVGADAIDRVPADGAD